MVFDGLEAFRFLDEVVDFLGGAFEVDYEVFVADG